ncbi:helix-turn-helix transcriptional regulator [Fluviibacter phosphoraccumulans]|uniref:helix-turn-helix transcriptional regulator n=1 Tax=Fluviibacter phosphoraccumulans TaxID=1751046 RepID=UPI0024E26A3C|nr:helix-turn-helix domain-containing protein [Fluviibacter phosphoraccumulans]
MEQQSTSNLSDKYLDRAEAADYIGKAHGLKVSKNTLQKYVTVGGGPTYRRFGKRAVYLASELDTWVQKKLSAPMCSSSAS